MKVSLTKKENNTAYFNLEVSKEQFEKALEEAYKKNAKRFVVPGFRKGKAPRILVERYYGPEVLYQDAAEIVLPKAYQKGIEDLKLEPVDRPKFDIEQIEKGKPLLAKVEVTVKPDVELEKYKGLDVEKIVYTVSEDDVDKELEILQEQNARLVTVEDRPAKLKDIAVIDFKGFIDDEPFDGGTAENYSLELGSNSFIAGFEEQIVGMKVNETKNIKVTFPQDYHQKDLAGKEAVFKVTLKELKEKELLPLDDEFAKDVSEFETLDELKNDIRKKLEERAESIAEGSLKASIVNKLLENAKVDVPEVMIENEIDRLAMDFALNLRYQGLNIETYLKFKQMSIEDFREELRDKALQNVKSALVLEEVAKKEGIEVTDEEVEKVIEEQAKKANQPLDEYKKTLKPENIANLRDRVLTQKIFDFLIENANITEKKPEDLKTDKSSAEGEKTE